jgi:hypothetical protein
MKIEALTLGDMAVMPGGTLRDSDDGREFSIAWLDRPDNISWRVGPDSELKHRKPVVAALASRFSWRGSIGT